MTKFLIIWLNSKYVVKEKKKENILIKKNFPSDNDKFSWDCMARVLVVLIYSDLSRTQQLKITAKRKHSTRLIFHKSHQYAEKMYMKMEKIQSYWPLKLIQQNCLFHIQFFGILQFFFVVFGSWLIVEMGCKWNLVGFLSIFDSFEWDWLF